MIAGSGDVSRPAVHATHLSGFSLWVVRAAWLIVVALAVGMFVAAIPARLAELRELCEAAPCRASQLSEAGAQTLTAMGISFEAYVRAMALIDVVSLMVYLPVTIFIFWRRSDDWLAIFVSLTLLLTATTLPTISALGRDNVLWARIAIVLNFLGFFLQVVLLYLFPTGRFEPRWTRWLALLWVPVGLAMTLTVGGISMIGLGILVVGLATGVAAQVYRYRRVSTSSERQQTKWAVFGFAFLFGGLLLSLLPGLFFPEMDAAGVPISSRLQLMNILISLPIAVVGLNAMPIMIAFAILRYRLWDIDLIIRRTLVYGLVMTVLSAMYVGSITLLQSAVVRLMGSTSPVVLVVSTLATVALFAPVRSRVQSFVDRRFNRSHYDAARTLREFGDVTRDEVVLENLETALLAVIQDTMQPSHASLWVHDPDPRVRPRGEG